jgi:hypothetical protein
VLTRLASVRRAARHGGILLSGLVFVGCAYQPTIVHPKAHGVRPEEAELSCAQLDLAILKADTVRWVIRDDGGTLETGGERVARYAANVIVIPLMLSGGGGYIRDHGSAVLDAADHRILGLLRLKRDHGCPPRDTAEHGMTDLQMLEVLEPLMPEDGELDRQSLDRRTALFDKLRVPLPAAANHGG